MPPRKKSTTPTRQRAQPVDQVECLIRAPDSQAKRIILRFGGVQPLLDILLSCGIRRSPQSLYHWVREGGLIPPRGMRDVMIAELKAGIRLTDEDWSPYGRPEASQDTVSMEEFEDTPVPPSSLPLPVPASGLDPSERTEEPLAPLEAPENPSLVKRKWSF